MRSKRVCGCGIVGSLLGKADGKVAHDDCGMAGWGVAAEGTQIEGKGEGGLVVLTVVGC